MVLQLLMIVHFFRQTWKTDLYVLFLSETIQNFCLAAILECGVHRGNNVVLLLGAIDCIRYV